MKVVFEPWALGDSVIASRSLFSKSSDHFMFVQEKWRKVLLNVFPEYKDRFIFFDCEYGARHAGSFLKIFQDIRKRIAPHLEVTEVYSARGDFRDYLVMKYLFPKAKIHMSGYLFFLAFRLRAVDLLFRTKIFKPENRYDAWSKLIHGRLFKEEKREKVNTPRHEQIIIHIGAQWLSRRYPYYWELYQELKAHFPEKKIILACSQYDKNIPDHLKKHFQTLQDEELISQLKRTALLVCNDTGVSHIADALGIPNLIISRVNNISVWRPPHSFVLSSPKSPQGYHPHSLYCSDLPLDSWSNAEEVFQKCLEVMCK